MTDPILTDVLSHSTSSIRPQDDLFRHVNGAWLESHEIPADRSSDGSFYQLHDESEDRVKEILEDLSAGSPEGDAKKIADYYDSFMDTETINAAGTDPLTTDLALVENATSKDELASSVGHLLRTGVSVPFMIDVDADINDPDAYAFYIFQAGLSLPDEAFYREPQHQETLDAFTTFVPEFMELSGLFSDPEESARRVIDFETKLAAEHADVVTTRNTDKTNNPMSWEEFTSSAPGFHWDAAMEATQALPHHYGRLIVTTPETFTGFAKLWDETDLEVLKDYVTWHILVARASYLNEELDNKKFEFFATKLTGATTQRDRWRRAIGQVSTVLGDAIGKIYVSKHFPPEYKEKMQELVADLLEAYRLSILDLDWMGEETKRRALAKLATFNPKIGYPDEWRNYDKLTIVDGDLVANVRNAHGFELDRSLAKVGQEMDRNEWYMSPQTVNAYYNPVWNEIAFPAAILQPPFFEMGADDAWNYGGIGAVIGHEIGHGFDDQGSKYDETGRLNNWWTEDDRTEFEKRTRQLIDQASAFQPAQLDGTDHYINGELTIGENIGDLGGLGIAIKAYEISLKRQGLSLADAPVIDGVTGLQRIFYSFARIWKNKTRREMAITLLSIDPHSPAEFRCNGIIKNLDSFAQAFDVTDGDMLYLPEDERVRIWS